MHQPMTEKQEQILDATRTYVTDLFQHKMDKRLVFHNLEHTEDVVEACMQMAAHYQLNDEDRFVLMVAAWFHDTGYLIGRAEGHEEASVQIATAFLQQQELDEPLLQRVVSAIQATKMPQQPVTQVEQILCDADLMHLATQDFRPRNELLKMERENLLQQKISGKEWRNSNVRFFENHRYFTDFGQRELEHRKAANLQELIMKKDKNCLGGCC